MATWNLESAWKENRRCDKPKASNVKDEDITEADLYLVRIAREVMAEPDPNIRAKMMHAALKYVLNYVRFIPPALDEDGKRIPPHEEMNYTISRVIEVYKESCRDEKERPAPGLIPRLRKRKFHEIDVYEWSELWDALGSTGKVDNQLMLDFYNYAYLSFKFLGGEEEIE